ncbi:MAG: hypothetical protein QOG23_2380 [Blastocatellia bacterium]|jgi:hypothetical protein|nr:hypothetical protein [Blastocatellia bacterium]
MITGPGDERSGRYECPHLGCDSGPTPQRIIDEIVSRDDWFWIVTAEIETEYREVLARPKF